MDHFQNQHAEFETGDEDEREFYSDSNTDGSGLISSTAAEANREIANQIPTMREALGLVSGLPGRFRQKRNCQKRASIGLTRREYQVLLILYHYGWCTLKMMFQVAVHHGIPWRSDYVYRVLTALIKHGFVIASKTQDGTKTLAYAASGSGIREISSRDDGLLCDTNVLKDPASLSHFLTMNRIMLKFIGLYPADFWMTDFQVRADNMHYGESGLAKDYDSVAQLKLPAGKVRIGIEYERTRKSHPRYMKWAAALSAEKYLHQVIFALEQPEMVTWLAPNFKRLGSLVCFMNTHDFLARGATIYARYWYADKWMEAPLCDILKGASQKSRPDYIPISKLTFRNSLAIW